MTSDQLKVAFMIILLSKSFITLSTGYFFQAGFRLLGVEGSGDMVLLFDCLDCLDKAKDTSQQGNKKLKPANGTTIPAKNIRRFC